MNTEHTNQPRQAANAAFEQWWQRHGLEDPMDDEDRYYITASSWARRGYLAAMQAQQAEPVAAQCRFEGEEWSYCTIAHHLLVQANPKEWPHYETRALYAQPPAVATVPQEAADSIRSPFNACCNKEHCRAMLAAAPQAVVAAPLPPYDVFSDDDGDSWEQHPASDNFVHGLQLGDEFELLAGWHAERVTFRVTKVPDNESDDYEVEEVTAPAAVQKGGEA